MLKKIIPLLIIVLAFGRCVDGDYKKPEDPVEAGSDFINFALKGDLAKAKLFILKDAANDRLFGEFEKKYHQYSPEEKSEYKNASIHVNKVQQLNDSTTIINYANSYKKEDKEVKLIKQNGEWWVDFKYTFVGNPVNPVAE